MKEKERDVKNAGKCSRIHSRTRQLVEYVKPLPSLAICNTMHFKKRINLEMQTKIMITEKAISGIQEYFRSRTCFSL